MKTKRYFTLLIALFVTALLACKKELMVPVNDFNVMIAKSSYNVGDTVTFIFSGNPGNITFYTGEAGFKYENRNRTTADGGIAELNFSTVYGGSGSQPGSLKLFVSSSIDLINQENMVDSKWTDISSKATFAPGTANTISGSIPLAPYVIKDKPLYIAYKFIGLTSPTTRPGNWVLSTFDVKNTLPDGSVSALATMATAGWIPFSIKNPTSVWTLPTTSRNEAFIIGGSLNSPESEDWLVTKPLMVNNVKPDIGIAIQSIASNAISEYKYVYTKAGDYKVTFVASNNSIDENREVIKTLSFNVKP